MFFFYFPFTNRLSLFKAVIFFQFEQSEPSENYSAVLVRYETGDSAESNGLK